VTLLPEVRDQLHATARRRVADATPTRLSVSRIRSTLGALGLAVSILVVVGVVAAIILNGHGTNPEPPAGRVGHALPTGRHANPGARSCLSAGQTHRRITGTQRGAWP
jgi:hypothetical protein